MTTLLPKVSSLRHIKLWPIALSLLVIANLAYFVHNIFGWTLILCFFLFMPGFLIMRFLKSRNLSRWELLSFSLGLSLFFLMAMGLCLNSLASLGLNGPLSTLNIFITLDIATLVLILATRTKTILIHKISIHKPSIVWGTLLVLLPLLAIGGALRLNNGASNELTMWLFGLITLVFLLLVWRKDLQPLYPYALFIMALSILLSVSLRGWSITGHDIQREFYVFQLTMQQNFWDIAVFRNPDPYNACLSITILPTLFAKLTGIVDAYIFKVVFQIIFAFAIVPIYFFIKKLAGTRLALIGSFLFLAFPTFLNDMTMLNRQEVGFVFFSLLMLLAFTDFPRNQKKLLTVSLLFGSILSHYSSSYVILGVMFGAWLIYALLIKLPKQKIKETMTFIFPTLNITVILVAILLIFLWNVQITGTSAGLQRTISKSINSFLNHDAAQSLDVRYSLLAQAKGDPQKLLNTFTQKEAGQTVSVSHVKEDTMPLTQLGQAINSVVPVNDTHATIRNGIARFLQLMLLVGLIVMLISYFKKPNQERAYFLALAIAALLFLILQTLLPQLSVDYGTLRLFQQLLIILALPIIVGMLFLLRRIRIPVVIGCSILFALLFLHLSGFIPQLTGGFAGQLSLNNSGFYYDAYLVDSYERKSAQWLINNREPTIAIAADPYALARFNDKYQLDNLVLTSPFSETSRAYLYKDRLNHQRNLFMVNINSNLYYYSVSRKNNNEHVIYSNGFSSVSKITKGNQ